MRDKAEGFRAVYPGTADASCALDCNRDLHANAPNPSLLRKVEMACNKRSNSLKLGGVNVQTERSCAVIGRHSYDFFFIR